MTARSSRVFMCVVILHNPLLVADLSQKDNSMLSWQESNIQGGPDIMNKLTVRRSFYNNLHTTDVAVSELPKCQT